MYVPYNSVKTLRTPFSPQHVSLLQIFNAITLHASQNQLHTSFRTLNDCIAKGKLSHCRPGQAWAGH
jgi:hypothetical protein